MRLSMHNFVSECHLAVSGNPLRMPYRSATFARQSSTPVQQEHDVRSAHANFYFVAFP
jgi:hypothetical protein